MVGIRWRLVRVVVLSCDPQSRVAPRCTALHRAAPPQARGADVRTHPPRPHTGALTRGLYSLPLFCKVSASRDLVGDVQTATYFMSFAASGAPCLAYFGLHPQGEYDTKLANTCTDKFVIGLTSRSGRSELPCFCKIGQHTKMIKAPNNHFTDP